MRVAASTGAEFSGEKTDNGEAHPLGKAKRLQELLFGMLKRGGNGIHGRNGQSTYLRQAECSMKRNYSEGGERAIVMRFGWRGCFYGAVTADAFS